MLNHKKRHFEFLHVTAFAVDRRVTTRIQLQTIVGLGLLIAAIAMLVVAALYQSAVPVKVNASSITMEDVSITTKQLNLGKNLPMKQKKNAH